MILKPGKILLMLLLATFCVNSFAQSYPFDLPENFKATLNINASNEEPFNNLLLGVNIHDLAHSEGQELVRDFDPITIRFPHGLFSNWYDWEQDKARVYGTDKFTYTKSDGSSRTLEIGYLSAIKTMDASNLYVGIDELNSLNNERKANRGEGYDMMWTFNMSADGPDFNNGSPVSVARYKDLIQRGFQVKAIEMGNENFYASQRSSIIPNHSDYIARARDMYKALKALNPEIKISVPLERKSIPANTGWNTDLTKDGTDYFDAVTVHTYVGYDPDDNSNSNEAFAVALTAREVLRKTIDDYSKVVAPDKPIWLTEWGVKSGGPNAVSALGAADCYMFMSENQDTYERANWFSVNGKLNSHLVWHEVNGKNEIKEPLEKTSYGSTYEIVRSVYENSTMLGSEMTVPTLDGVVNAVNARAVKKDGRTIIFALNMTNQEVPFSINMDGQRFFGEFEHKAFAFSSMDHEISLPYNDDPLQLIKAGRGNIYLPMLSMNVIVLNDNEVMELDFEGLKNNDEIDKGSNLSVKANAREKFQEVSLYVNDSLLSSQTEAPYVWSNYPVLIQMMDPTYRLKLVGKTDGSEIIEREITISTPEQWAYTESYKPHRIPGKIEVEHYDYGGENIAYYDKADQKENYTYRGEDKVDLGSNGEWLKFIQGKEWLEYTVEVERSGNYSLAVKHQTRRSPEFEAMSFLFQDQNEALFGELVFTHTGSDATAIDTFTTAYLEKGRHILRLDILGYGYDLDYFEFILTSNPIDYENVGTLNKPLNPDSYDTGTELQTLAVPKDSLGFDFAGWYSNAACTDNVLSPVIACSDEEGKVFYAKWIPQVLTGHVLIYGDVIVGNSLFVNSTAIENNSGELSYQWQRLNNGEFVNIPGANDPTYGLMYADTSSQLRVIISSSLQTGQVISNTTNIILGENETVYTISYHANGGEDGTFTIEQVGAGGFPTFIAQPQRDGYVINAWTNVVGDTITQSSMIRSDTTLYAQWEVEMRYKVYFHLGDSLVEKLTDEYPAVVKQLPENPLQADSIFIHWNTEFGESFDSTYLVFEDMHVYAKWEVKRFPIHVISAHGGIVYEPEQSYYEIHTEVTLTAVPFSKYEFVNWTGDFESGDSSITVTVDSTLNLTANYKDRPYYALDVYFSKGTVTKFPNSSRYLSGDTVVLTAIPDAGYEFVSWTGDYTGSENPLTLIMTEDMEIDAIFQSETSVREYVNPVSFMIYPNPAHDVCMVSLGDNKQAYYRLFSITGMEMKGGILNSKTEIRLDELNPGMYVLKVISGGGASAQKLVVNP